MLTQADWFKVVCDSYSNPPIVVEGVELPGFPPDEMQTNTTGMCGIATLTEAYAFYTDCTAMFAKLGTPIGPNHRLLDFGVGWGRIARFFLREVPKDKIYGIDVTAEFVEVCRQTFQHDNFFVTTPFPPSKFPDGKFNFIVGYSVFSHLSERACAEWMKEFHRILAPGGLVAMTTRGARFFDYCESLRGRSTTGYLDALSKMFDDFEAARSRYKRGEFVHSNRGGIDGGGAMTADFYGESFIPKKYAKSAYANHFALKRFVFDPKRQAHPIMFFKKI
jgi:SAM-dependent methyltransferase